MAKTKKGIPIDNKSEIREELDQYLYGLVICDYITRKEQAAVLKDFDKWVKTAEDGEAYYYDGNPYTYKIEGYDEI